MATLSEIQADIRNYTEVTSNVLSDSIIGTMIDNTENIKFQINPSGGFKHFGNVNGDFVVVRGSVPGTYNRLIKLRSQIRDAPLKITKPNVLEIVI